LFEFRSHGNDISRTADVLVLCNVTLRTLTTYSYSGGAADPTARGTHNIHTMELFVTPVMRPWNNFADVFIIREICCTVFWWYKE
jgi:hypothetical protein